MRRIARCLRIFFPPKVAALLGIGGRKSKIQNIRQHISKLLGIRDIETWMDDPLFPEFDFHFRASEHQKIVDPYRKGWYASVRALGAKLPEPKAVFSRNALEELASEMHKYTLEDDGIPNFLLRLQDEAGIKIIVFDHFIKTRIDGACFLSDAGCPVVVITQRLKRVDYFWFTLAHELAHVALHLNRQKNAIIDGGLDSKDHGTSDVNQIEDEANALASTWLHTQSLPIYHGPSISQIKSEADQRHIGTAILIGALRHKELVPYHLHAGHVISYDPKLLDPWRVEISQLVLQPVCE